MAINKKGHVLIEALVGLIAFAALLAIMVNMIISMHRIDILPSSIAHDIAIKQLQWQISINSNLYYSTETYCFDYLIESRCLQIKNDRLIMTPGTQIILVGLKSMQLFEREGGLWVSGYNKNEFKEWFIGHLQK